MGEPWLVRAATELGLYQHLPREKKDFHHLLGCLRGNTGSLSPSRGASPCPARSQAADARPPLRLLLQLALPACTPRFHCSAEVLLHLIPHPGFCSSLHSQLAAPRVLLQLLLLLRGHQARLPLRVCEGSPSPAPWLCRHCCHSAPCSRGGVTAPAGPAAPLPAVSRTAARGTPRVFCSWWLLLFVCLVI